jgi:hypothetical protein
MAALAETPDDCPTVAGRLRTIVELAVDVVSAASYASVSDVSDQAGTTVAVGRSLRQAVDDIDDQPIGSTATARDAADRGATIRWPMFYQVAPDMGLRGTVSVPLFVGSGAPAAVLDLYSHDPAALAPLVVGVWSIYRPGRMFPAEGYRLHDPDPGGRELLAGFAESVAVRSLIQGAIQLVMAGDGRTATDAYLELAARATAGGISLTAVANSVLSSKA